uniref:Uncharacterized protein n=1 Tax=Rhizophagus irregularis (strain DAOM 181602 / DAOM 197198 / MUCL 43194) TaxID=747089 RepID=U9TML5_RHIID
MNSFRSIKTLAHHSIASLYHMSDLMSLLHLLNRFGNIYKIDKDGLVKTEPLVVYGRQS